MKIVGISASPRHGNTEILVRKALDVLAEEYQAEVEMVSFVGKKISGCRDCKACLKAHRCIIKDDWEELINPLLNPVPDGLIIGSPVYMFGVTSQLKAFFERCQCLFNKIWFPAYPSDPPDWSMTAAGAIAVGNGRHGGQEHVIQSIVQWYLLMGFPVVGGSYGGGGAWAQKETQDAVLDDPLGLKAAQRVAQKVGNLARVLADYKNKK